ncbi:MAG: thioesterase [Pseudomonadales bacterium]|nr:thioesterase [Pseudomonadales bacterium]RLT89187.1 MAG: PaaI family thioesterase [Ketobacter sp. GenoA1]RLT97290.1 MAG: PaaI family thioesterase [Ketobacter sp.]TNC87749.1 MAG: thioesterase [Alcanivorax sp.]HAG93885.1 thioesterase [Gammaproteobacteria bacterium]
MFLNGVKHSMVLGMTLEEITPEGLIVRLPYSDKIIGNPDTGVIHGGAITSLMDQACGLAVAQAMSPDFDITPTIDLRIDYMRPAEPPRDVFAYVTAYRKTRSVVFARGVAYQDSRDQPIAHCVANFMRMGLSKVPWQAGPGAEAAS